MNRREFGELIAALRQDMGWTQFQLAEYSDIDHAVISQIERGVKKFFEPELLFCLANTFRLSTLERKEFILAASGLDAKQIVRQPSVAVSTDVFNARKLLDKMVKLTGEIRLPAYLVDVYCDVIAANWMMIAFYNVPSSILENAARIPGGFNTVRLNFGRDLLARNRISDNWDYYAVNSMHAFRANSLQYRAKPYFKYLMKVFRNPTEYPFFDRFWKLVSSADQDKEVNVDQFSYQHSEFGQLKYLASTTVAITSFGNLFLTQNLPLDEHTEDVFTQLRLKAGLGVEQFASWPVKQMI
jgi:transcriptional regulator with XRE-family HTH domain